MENGECLKNMRDYLAEVTEKSSALEAQCNDYKSLLKNVLEIFQTEEDAKTAVLTATIKILDSGAVDEYMKFKLFTDENNALQILCDLLVRKQVLTVKERADLLSTDDKICCPKVDILAEIRKLSSEEYQSLCSKLILANLDNLE